MLLNVPVFTIDIIPKPALVEVSDVVAINIHPFYRLDLPHVANPEEMSDEIVKAAAQQIDIYRNMAPDKELVITEIGWPSDSSEQTDPNVGSMELSRLFLKVSVFFAPFPAAAMILCRSLQLLQRQPICSIISLRFSMRSGRWIGILIWTHLFPNFTGDCTLPTERRQNSLNVSS